VRYWYSAWQRIRATRRTEHKLVTVLIVRAGRLVVGWVPPGGMMQQKPWRFGGAWRHETDTSGGGAARRLAAERVTTMR